MPVLVEHELDINDVRSGDALLIDGDRVRIVDLQRGSKTVAVRLFGRDSRKRFIYGSVVNVLRSEKTPEEVQERAAERVVETATWNLDRFEKDVAEAEAEVAKRLDPGWRDGWFVDAALKLAAVHSVYRTAIWERGRKGALDDVTRMARFCLEARSRLQNPNIVHSTSIGSREVSVAVIELLGSLVGSWGGVVTGFERLVTEAGQSLEDLAKVDQVDADEWVTE